MPKVLPIAIAILQCKGKFLFIKRRSAPYEGLWSLVGGKVGLGEHIHDAAIREIVEETGCKIVEDFSYRGFVSERLVQPSGELVSHFLIFVSYATISSFESNHREGDLALFTLSEIEDNKDTFLPSDYHMFKGFMNPANASQLYEAELVQANGRYTLNYYRMVSE
ncbi:MAG: NUDIX hydrolase [Candidatus Thorarchaeota archaeon]|nr:NUDIX hydrolase [Candidatus Thorarchaeota archaeon]